MAVILSMEQNRVTELEEILKKAREEYYNLSPSMSDQEYDARKAELAFLAPQSVEVTTVGASVTSVSVWEKSEHVIPMGSLDKVNTKEEFLDWSDGTNSKLFLMTYKVDGSSMELVYEKGKLVRAVTRGDGLIGEDVTFNVKQVPDVPHQIDDESDQVVVRGEVVMDKSVFETKYSKDYANPRNTANGKIREKKNKGVDCQNLSFVAYTLYANGNRVGTEQDQFETLERLGFRSVYYITGNKFDIAVSFERMKEVRGDIPYEIDGMVIRVLDISEQDALGSRHMKPVGQIAWKFDAAMSTTKVVDIKWQIGNSGRVTPVASLEPVQIGGVTITSVSLHNMAMFNKMKLFAGCEVLIARRNDVIPFLEENLSLKISAAD